MKFWEAMRALEEGKKIRCSCWEPHRWISRKGFDDGVPLYGMDFQYCLMKDTEWELYEEPVQLLSFAEVVRGLREGKRFRRASKDKIVSWDKDGLWWFGSWKAQDEWPKFELEDFEATDWIEVKE